MTGATLSRADLVELLCTFDGREPAAVGDGIDSLELAWLVHQIEERLGHRLDLSDDDLTAMSTVDGVLTVLARAPR